MKRCNTYKLGLSMTPIRAGALTSTKLKLLGNKLMDHHIKFSFLIRVFIMPGSGEEEQIFPGILERE